MELNEKVKIELFEMFKEWQKMPLEVSVEVCREGIKLPVYANIGDAGMDIRAAEDVVILPGETKVIPTGIKVAVPEGCKLEVCPRSGLSLNTPLRVANTPGTIDSGYRDEIGIIISNTSPSQYYNSRCRLTFDIKDGNCHWNNYTIDEKGNKTGIYQIKFGDRIAQIVLVQFKAIKFEQVEDIKTLGLNRGGGFGSTGVK